MRFVSFFLPPLSVPEIDALAVEIAVAHGVSYGEALRAIAHHGHAGAAGAVEAQERHRAWPVLVTEARFDDEEQLGAYR